jgi:hypothetical protein
MSLDQESITFGKYKGSTLSQVLRDRSYCRWLVEQEWFQTSYEYLYNRVKEYEPRISFLGSQKEEPTDFMNDYTYFNLPPVDKLEIALNNVDRVCYEYYLRVIRELRGRIYQRLENEEENPYDIKAPTRWLQRFEREYGIPRGDFKEFLSAYELLNIPYIIERIKKEGGLKYKGAESFNIARSRSLKQEAYWEQILKERYGEDLGTQFKYENCIFDFLNISTKTIFECKLGLKDFDETQHMKYQTALKEYRIVYLISRDCVIEMERGRLYTTSADKYRRYLLSIPMMKAPSYLDCLIKGFDTIEVGDLSYLFGFTDNSGTCRSNVRALMYPHP